MLIHDRLAELIELLPIYDSRVRRHEPGGIHKMRVTLRRLRSLLATFGPLFDTGVVASLRAELRWIAGELGDARDSEVIHKRMHAIATTPAERAVADHVASEMDAAAEAGRERAVTALDTERYSALLRELNSFATDPPWSSEEADSSEEQLRGLVRREWKRTRRRARRAKHAQSGAEHHALLHEVRKSAKRLRYASETLVPLSSEDAKNLARAAKRVQTELGEVQDSAMSQALLRRRATESGTPPEEIFLLGGMAAHERFLADSAEVRFVRRWKKLARRKNRRWLA